MKKITKILAACILAASALCMTGCQEGDEIVNELAGPAKKWCSMPVEYKNSDEAQAANIYVHFYWSSTDTTSTSNAAKALKKGYTIPAGLTIVITAVSDASSIISGLTNSAYIIKTFPLDGEVAADDTDSTYKVSGTRDKWSAIYWLKSDLRQADNQDSNPPSQLTNNGGGTELSWDSIKNEFSWKRLIANYLLNSL